MSDSHVLMVVHSMVALPDRGRLSRTDD